MTYLETMQENYANVKAGVDATALQIAEQRTKRLALLSRQNEAESQIRALEQDITTALMGGGNVSAITGKIAALTSEVTACRSLAQKLHEQIETAERNAVIGYGLLESANNGMLNAEYREIAQTYGDGIKALLPLLYRMQEISPQIGAGFNIGQGWVIDPRDPIVGNVRIAI
ncbi:MAG: hypothetical protein V4446_13630 [Pseudomonadota bacterium]